ncbi:Ipi1 N domain containing protein [Trichuris trichiura]|uniref:Ipi1 N domain containing protein n=1 Tax=Trichuris trichiura TaxID=36087 RepID=A0A077Z3B4_TRITR|nr:Ipi1 N domain containing protein [Trichuris trichiura]
MGRSKAKRKREDFQKVKLKVGRKLRKPNETKVDFKVKKIVLPCQTDDWNATTLRTSCSLSLEDCCRLLIHHNMSKRRVALRGLLELLSMDSSLGSSNLSKLLECILPSLTAADTVVRQLTSQAVSLLMGLVTSRQLSSYFPLIAGHICCGITHIDVPVKVVSAELLDCILQKHPIFLKSCSRRVIGLFVQLYMPCREDSCSKDKSSLLIDDKLLSNNERTRILRSLLKFLQVLLFHTDEQAAFSGPFSYAICTYDNLDNDEFDIRTFLMESGPAVLNCLLSFWFEVAWCRTTDGELRTGEITRSFGEEELKDMILILRTLNILIDYYVSLPMARQAQKRFAKLLNAKVMDKVNALFPIRRSGRTEHSSDHTVGKCYVTDTCIDVNVALCYFFVISERLTGESAPSSCLDNSTTYLFRLLEKRNCSPTQLMTVLQVLSLRRWSDKELITCLLKFFVSNRASITAKHHLLIFINDHYDALGLHSLAKIENIDFFVCLMKLESSSQASHVEAWPIHHSIIVLLEKILCLNRLELQPVKNVIEKIWCSLLHAAAAFSCHLRRRCFSLAFRLAPFSRETLHCLVHFMRKSGELEDICFLFEMVLHGYSGWLNDCDEEHLVDLLSFLGILICCSDNYEKTCSESRADNSEAVILEIKSSSIPPLHYWLQLKRIFTSWLASITFDGCGFIEHVIVTAITKWITHNGNSLSAEQALCISLWSLECTCSSTRKLAEPISRIFWSALCYLNNATEKLHDAELEGWRNCLANYAIFPSLLLPLLESAFGPRGKEGYFIFVKDFGTSASCFSSYNRLYSFGKTPGAFAL